MTNDPADHPQLKPMRGFFALLTDEQKAKVLAYRGPDGVEPMPSEPKAPKAKAGSTA